MPTATFDQQRWDDMLVAVADELRQATIKHAAQAIAAYYSFTEGTRRYQAIGLTTALAGLY